MAKIQWKYFFLSFIYLFIYVHICSVTSWLRLHPAISYLLLFCRKSSTRPVWSCLFVAAFPAAQHRPPGAPAAPVSLCWLSALTAVPSPGETASRHQRTFLRPTPLSDTLQTWLRPQSVSSYFWTDICIYIFPLTLKNEAGFMVMMMRGSGDTHGTKGCWGRTGGSGQTPQQLTSLWWC